MGTGIQRRRDNYPSVHAPVLRRSPHALPTRRPRAARAAAPGARRRRPRVIVGEPRLDDDIGRLEIELLSKCKERHSAALETQSDDNGHSERT
jgi:hypothetical protein